MSKNETFLLIIVFYIVALFEKIENEQLSTKAKYKYKSAFNRAGSNALDEVLLQAEEQDNHWCTGKQNSSEGIAILVYFFTEKLIDTNHQCGVIHCV